LFRDIFTIIFRNVPRSLKVRLLWAGFVMVANSGLQILVSLSFIPYMALVRQEDMVMQYLPISYVDHVNHISEGIYVLELSLIYIVFIAVGLLFSVYNDLFIHRVSGDIKSFLQIRLFENYLYKNYEYFTRVSTSQVTKVISEESNKIDQITYASLNFISNGIILILFVAIFMLRNVGLAFGVVFLGSIVLLFNRLFISNSVNVLGSRIGEFFEKRIKLLNESVEGIKEIRVNSLETKILDSFGDYTNDYNKSYVKYNIISGIPRYFVIFILYGSVAIIFSASELYSASNKFFSDLAFLGISSLRIIPSLQAVVTSIVSVNFHKSVLVVLKSEDLRTSSRPSLIKTLDIGGSARKECSIEFRSVSFAFSEERLVLSNVSFILEGSSFIGISGPSGSGKTTLVNLIMGLLEPRKGEILLNGNALNFDSNSQVTRFLSYVPQNTFLFDDTIANNVCLSDQFDEVRLLEALKLSECDFLTNTFDLFVDKVGERGNRLSGGQKQRIGLARALYKNNPILILDESTSALDNDLENKILVNLKVLSERDSKLILFITHKESNLERMSGIFKVDDGTLSYFSSYSLFKNFKSNPL